MVPINVSCHDSQENHFPKTELKKVTKTNTYKFYRPRFLDGMVQITEKHQRHSGFGQTFNQNVKNLVKVHHMPSVIE